MLFFFFFNDTATTEIYTLSLHDALPIYRGPVADVVFPMVGALRSGMGYCGVCDIAALRTETEFIRITTAGLRESHPHDVVIPRESPNYSLSALTPRSIARSAPPANVGSVCGTQSSPS